MVNFRRCTRWGKLETKIYLDPDLGFLELHFLIPELFEKYFWKCGLPKFFLGHILSFSLDYWFDHQTGLLAQWHTTLKVIVLKIYIWVKYNNFKMGCNWAKKVVHELQFCVLKFETTNQSLNLAEMAISSCRIKGHAAPF